LYFRPSYGMPFSSPYPGLSRFSQGSSLLASHPGITYPGISHPALVSPQPAFEGRSSVPVNCAESSRPQWHQPYLSPHEHGQVQLPDSHLQHRIGVVGGGGGEGGRREGLDRGRPGGSPQSSWSSSSKVQHVKKPLNAFMLFMKEMRQRVIDECTLKESAAINQVLGRKVKNMWITLESRPFP